MTPPPLDDSSGLSLYEPDSETIYTLEATSDLSGVSQRMILVYYKHGLVKPIADDPEAEGWNFDEEALRTLRRIEHLRATCSANLVGLKLILDLMDEVERLRADLRFRR